MIFLRAYLYVHIFPIIRKNCEDSTEVVVELSATVKFRITSPHFVAKNIKFCQHSKKLLLTQRRKW